MSNPRKDFSPGPHRSEGYGYGSTRLEHVFLGDLADAAENPQTNGFDLKHILTEAQDRLNKGVDDPVMKDALEKIVADLSAEGVTPIERGEDSHSISKGENDG